MDFLHSPVEQTPPDEGASSLARPKLRRVNVCFALSYFLPTETEPCPSALLR